MHPSHHNYVSQCRCGQAHSPLSTRRGFLGAVGALGVLGASGCANLAPVASAAHRIDVHHHISPPEWVSALKKSQLDTPPVNDWTPARSLEDMDKAGIATSITSPTLPAVGFLPAAEAARVARASNETPAAWPTNTQADLVSLPCCPCPMWMKRSRRSPMRWMC